jgi:hypothetical protein
MGVSDTGTRRQHADRRLGVRPGGTFSVTDQTRRVTDEVVVALFRSAVWDLQLAPGVEAGALLEHVGRHRLPACALDARQAVALTRFG